MSSGSNFGPLGVVSSSISIVSTTSNIDSSYLAQGGVLLNGYVPNSAVSSAELAAIDTWVRDGGILISTTDATTHQDISSSYGLTVTDGASDIWRIVDTTNPIINGPFGLVGNIGNTFFASGSISYFNSASLDPGDLVIAEDTLSGQPTMVLRALGDGYILFTSDEGIFRANMTGGGVISTGNVRLTANTMAWGASLVEAREFQTLNLNVDPVNDAPVQLSIEGTALNYSENEGQKAITNTLVLNDIDDTNLESATIAITGSYLPAEDLLAFTDTANITSSWNAATGVLTLSGSDTVSAYQGALRAVSYENTSDNLTTTTRTISFSVNDGEANSNTASRSIDLSAVNDAPILSSIEGTTLAYTENDGAVLVTSTLTLTDTDDSNLESARISITPNLAATQDILAFTNTASITGSWNTLTGVLTLSGTDTIANYQAALRSITYENSSEDPSQLARTVTFSVNDGNLNSAGVTRSLSVSQNNDAPVQSSIEPTAITYTENDVPQILTTTLAISDVDDSFMESATVSISGNYTAGEDVLAFTDTPGISGSFNSATGELVLTGTDTIAAYESALRTITYENTSANPSALSRTVSFVVNDGNLNAAVATRDINIVPVNNAPIQNSIESTVLNYNENEGPRSITSTLILSDVDDINLESASVAIGASYVAGEDVLAFSNTGNISGSFNAITGVKTLTGTDTVAAYQAALRSVTYENTSDNPSTLNRTLSFIVTDGDSNAATVTRTIAVLPVNDAPVQNSIETGALAVTENIGPLVLTSSITLADIDDLTLDSATVSLTGNYINGEDILSFTNTPDISGNFNALTGVMTVTGTDTVAAYQAALRAVTYENNSDNPSTVSRTVTFTVDDGNTNSAAVSRNIDIIAVNDAPVQSTIEATAIAYSENDGNVAVTSTITLSDVDDTNLASASVSITSNYVAGEDILSFVDTANINASFNALSGTLTLSGTDSVAAYEAALRSVNYTNTSDNPSGLSRTMSFVVNDGNRDASTVTRTLNVTPINDAPTLASMEVTALPYTENDLPAVVSTSLAPGDLDDTTLETASISISGNYSPGEDILAYTNTAAITGTFNAVTGVLTLTGSDTVGAYQNALRSVTYHNTSDDPSPLDRTITFTINDGEIKIPRQSRGYLM
ncbi:hypothetical protein AB833_24385 [Chromatiales bacterium (ex Bugula neritina AB1)]|nr:hypothetical protein AB833_24385 [Chromatiales bacterium (ex Bugula neritina AB1)]